MNELLEKRTEPIDHIVLSVDTSDIEEAHRLVGDFAAAGGTIVKLGLEAASAPGFGGPEGLSELALEHGVIWVYDGKLKDINNTMVKTVRNIVAYKHPPLGITMHADTSFKTMRAAQETAGNTVLFGVTLLTDISPEEAFTDYSNNKERELVRSGHLTVLEAGEVVRVREVLKRGQKLGSATVKGLVASAKELAALQEDETTRSMTKLIPGTRSERAARNDQENTMTPEDAMALGADLLVLGRQYTNAEDKPQELRIFKDEVARGLERKYAS